MRHCPGLVAAIAHRKSTHMNLDVCTRRRDVPVGRKMVSRHVNRIPTILQFIKIQHSHPANRDQHWHLTPPCISMQCPASHRAIGSSSSSVWPIFGSCFFFLVALLKAHSTNWRIFWPTGWLMKQNKPLQIVTADVYPLHGRSLMHNGARAETRRKGSLSACLELYINLRVFSWSKLHFEAPQFWEAIEDIRVKDEWPHWWHSQNLIVGERIDEERWKMEMVMVMEHNRTRLKRHTQMWR